jgi:phosphatidylserine decarboxylase
MKHAGRARRSAFKLIFWTFIALVLILVGALLMMLVSSIIIGVWAGLIAVWIIFALFTLYFFRDPEARVPLGQNLIVSPGHGKVDLIDEFEENEFMGGKCQRVSMFLSVIDIHVQNAPVAGKVHYVKYRPGKFMAATATECAAENECVYIGFIPSDRPTEKFGIRLIAGILARRIVPFVEEGEVVPRGERISLIQFGSRVDIYLPYSAKLKIKLGDRLVGGESVIAEFDKA